MTEPQTLTVEEQNIKSLWTALRVAEGQLEKRGLPFGEAVFKLREKYKIQGTRNDLTPEGVKLEGYFSILNKLGIPEETARRWCIRYEESIGTRNKVEPIAQRGTASRYVSPDDSSSAEGDLPLGSEPEPTPSTPVVSREEKDREQLRFLAHRLDSLSIALRQVVENKAKWSRCKDEYAEVRSLGGKITRLVELL
jgi:hypothetical protein